MQTRRRLATDKMFDLAGVHFSQRRRKTKDFGEEHLQDAALSNDSVDYLKPFFAQPKEMIAVFLDILALYELPQRNRNTRPADLKISRNVRIASVTVSLH